MARMKTTQGKYDDLVTSSNANDSMVSISILTDQITSLPTITYCHHCRPPLMLIGDCLCRLFYDCFSCLHPDVPVFCDSTMCATVQLCPGSQLTGRLLNAACHLVAPEANTEILDVRVKTLLLTAIME